MISKRTALICVALVAVGYYWQTRIKRGPMCDCAKDLNGKTVLITGGNNGIGKATATEFAKMGAKVIIASRNDQKSKQAVKEIIESSSNKNVISHHLDLEDFNSVRKLAKDLESEKLDYLVNNGGTMGLEGISSCGFNRVFTINHLGHFLLTNLILEQRSATSGPIRVINVSSDIYKVISEIDYDFIKQSTSGLIDVHKMYAVSKLANVLFTSELHRRFHEKNITAYSLTPGFVETGIGNNLPNVFGIIMKIGGRPVIYGAQTILYCALTDVEQHSGKYFKNCHLEELLELAQNQTAARLLWDASMRATKLKAK